MTDDEIDLDAFTGLGSVVELEPPVPVDPTWGGPIDVSAAIAGAVRAAQEFENAAAAVQMTIEGGAEPVQPGAASDVRLIAAIVFQSHPDSQSHTGHVVTVLDLANERVVTCTCPAVRNLARRPQGCWAMQLTRRIVGIDMIEGGS